MRVINIRRNNLSVFFLLAGFFTVFQNCGDNPLAPSDRSIIEGKVLNATTARPIEGVLVRSFSFAKTALTDQEGLYSIEAQLADSSSKLVALSFTKDGFFESSVTVAIQNGEKTTVPDASLVQKSGPVGGSSSDAANVILVDVETNSVFVKSSGGNETTTITFEVRDANGIPVDLAHQVKVCFNIVTGPNGGEFVNPDSVLTDANGRAATTLNSGTLPGTVQVQAEVIGTTINSDPIPVTITGWLPDATHFSIAPNLLNFPGYDILNLRDQITVLLGDKFSNPVPPGTAVYFETTGGLIQGSAITNADGLAAVELISGRPKPSGINFSSLRTIASNTLPSYFQEKGYALVTAKTSDEFGADIYAETVVLFSGGALITTPVPNAFDLAPDEFEDITFSVKDQNNNPLAAGTNIVVSTNNGGITGDSNTTLDDNLLREATTFRIRVSNSKPAEIEGEATTVTINVSGPNGSTKVNIFGFMRKN